MRRLRMRAALYHLDLRYWSATLLIVAALSYDVINHMRIVVVGGGTATNAITSVFFECSHNITYVVPISDNGGSTSEILRVFGGPAIGDARSRLVRLIDASPLRTLLAMRLSSNEQLAAREWSAVVDGTHEVWIDVPPYMKAMYRSFLVHVHAELLKKTTTMRKFDFRYASIGNLLLTGARLFFGTLEAAIEFILHTNRVPAHLSVLPCVNSSFSHHIAALLYNGNVVVGQSQISHPTNASTNSDDEDGTLFSHPDLQVQQITFTKNVVPPLPSKINSLYYINTLGHEIKPKISPRVITHLQMSDAVIFSIGSLYTSIIPVLLLQGFAKNMPKKRILILNGSPDRETEGMDPQNYLEAVTKALMYSLGGDTPDEKLITNVIYPAGLSEIYKINFIHCEAASCPGGEYNNESLIHAIKVCMKMKTI